MARVPYLDRKDVKPEHQDLLARGINLYRALVHSPDGLRSFSALGHFIRHTSRLDPRLRELAILQVGYLARSPYEYSHHVEIGRDFGVSDEDIRAIADETAGRPTQLEPIAKAVLRAAREMTTDLDDLGADLRGAAPRARSRAPDRSRAHHRLLQRGRSHPRDPADRRRGRLSQVSRRVPAAEGLMRWSRVPGECSEASPSGTRPGDPAQELRSAT